MPIWGRPPESESTRHGVEVDVATPFGQYKIILVVLAWVVLAAYAVAAILVGYRAGATCRGWQWWAPYIEGIGAAVRFVLHWAWLPPVVWFCPMAYFTAVLVWDRMRVALIAPSWPPPSQAADARLAAQTYRQAQRETWRAYEDELEDEPEQEEPAPVWNVNAKLENGGKQTLYAQFPIPDAARWDWYRYCCDWQKQRKPKWSVGGFRGYKLNRDFYKDVTDAFEAVGAVVVTKSYSDGRQEHEPTAKGRAYLHAFSTTPPPEY